MTEQSIIDRFLSGEVAGNLALMQLFITAADESAAQHALDAAMTQVSAADRHKLADLQRLWDSAPESFSEVRDVYRTATVDLHGAESQRIRRLAQVFDDAAAISPATGVALYSLGNDALLEQATDELARLIHSWKLLDAKSVAADLGCGSGRVVRALARSLACIVGLDISEQMLLHAERRRPGNAMFVLISGGDLAPLREVSFDLLLGIDSFPYVVQAGVTTRWFHECARVLRPGGHLLIMNFAYGPDLAVQRAAVAELAAAHGFAVLRSGERNLHLWDGASFLLQKATAV